MWPLIVLAVLLGLLILLAILPLGIRILYNADGFRLKVLVGPVPIALYPVPEWLRTWVTSCIEKWKKKPKKDEKKKGEKESAEPQKKAEEKPKKKFDGSLTDFLPLLNVLLDFFGDVRRKIRVGHLELKLILASSDPCDLAVNYGRAWAAMGNLIPLLEETFVIKKRDVEVECDFLAEQTRVIARLDISVTVGRIFSLGLRYGIRTLKEFMNITKTIEGGAENEPKSS